VFRRGRRPRQHLRHVDDHVIMVNRGVNYDDPASSPQHRPSTSSLTELGVMSYDDIAQLPAEKLPLGIKLAGPRRPVRHATMPYRNLSDQSTFEILVVDSDFHGSVFNGSKFSHTNFRNVNMAEASLKNVAFWGSRFTNTDMRGADVTGASFQNSAPTRGILDVTDSNITREQIAHLNLEFFNPAQGRMYGEKEYVRYRQYTPDDIVSGFDVDHETLKVLMWTSGTELRDNETYAIVSPADFDPSRHHVPQWEIPGLGLTPR
jgi:hypothetical protein